MVVDLGIFLRPFEIITRLKTHGAGLVKVSWAVPSESSLRSLIILEDHFGTGGAEGTGVQCKKGSAYACDELALDLEDVCDFGLLHLWFVRWWR